MPVVRSQASRLYFSLRDLRLDHFRRDRECFASTERRLLVPLSNCEGPHFTQSRDTSRWTGHWRGKGTFGETPILLERLIYFDWRFLDRWIGRLSVNRNRSVKVPAIACEIVVTLGSWLLRRTLVVVTRSWCQLDPLLSDFDVCAEVDVVVARRLNSFVVLIILACSRQLFSTLSFCTTHDDQNGLNSSFQNTYLLSTARTTLLCLDCILALFS